MQHNEIIGYKSPAHVRAKTERVIKYPFHTHQNDFEVMCVLQGSVRIWDYSAEYELREGAVHVFNPPYAHMISGGDNVVLFIHIDCSYYEKYFKDLRRIYFISDTIDAKSGSTADMKYLRFLLARIAGAYKESGTSTAIEQHTKELISFMSEHFTDYVFYSDNKRGANLYRLHGTEREYLPSGIRQYNDRIYRIVDYVEEHYHEKLMLRDLAQQENVSESFLSREIGKKLGMSYSNLVSLTRSFEASKLLYSTELTVDQIAEECGFCDRKELARHFRKWHKMTPTEFRKEVQWDIQTGNRIVSERVGSEIADPLLDRYLDAY